MSPKTTIIFNAVMIVLAIPVLALAVPALVSAANTFLVLMGILLAGLAFLTVVFCVLEIVDNVGKLNGEETDDKEDDKSTV